MAPGHRRDSSRSAAITVGFAVRTPVHACLRNLLGEGCDIIGKDLHPILSNLHASLHENRIIGIQKLDGLAVDIGPGNDFDKSALVFQIETPVAVALLGVSQFESRHDPGDLDVSCCGFFFQLGDRPTGNLLNHSVIFVQRVAGNIKPKRLLLES
jgi:hypothetical protein